MALERLEADNLGEVNMEQLSALLVQWDELSGNIRTVMEMLDVIEL